MRETELQNLELQKLINGITPDQPWLVLRNKDIGDEGAKAIGEALKTNKILKRLILENNNIGDEGAKAIGEALKTNTTLTMLDLNHNNIGDEGAKAIGEALKTNTTLTTLDLNYNNIGDEGAKAIGEALKTNKTLKSLVLLWNNKNIGQVGRDAIGDALEKNETLTMLDLNFYLSDLSPKIDQYIKRNRALNHVAVNAIATFYALGLLKSEDDALQLMARADAVEKKNLVLRHSTQINKVGQNNNNNNNGSCSYKHK